MLGVSSDMMRLGSMHISAQFVLVSMRSVDFLRQQFPDHEE